MKRNPIIPYDPRLKERARELRKNATVAEKLLWRRIRGKNLGFEFLCQVPIDRFIVDFNCHELLLAIEIDGSTHDSERACERDRARHARIESSGVSFLRFYDHEVRENLTGAVKRIENWIEASHLKTSREAES